MAMQPGEWLWFIPRMSHMPRIFHTLQPRRRAFLAGNFAHAQNRAEKQVVVNGRAIHCVAVKHWPGVGAASPDGVVCNAACARYYKYTSFPGALTGSEKLKRLDSPENADRSQCRIRHHTGYKSVTQS